MMRSLLTAMLGSFLMWLGFTFFLGWYREYVPFPLAILIFASGAGVAIASGKVAGPPLFKGVILFGIAALVAAVPMALVSPHFVNNGSGQDAVDLGAYFSGVIVGGTGLVAIIVGGLMAVVSRKA